jgi:hypothetical protein
MTCFNANCCQQLSGWKAQNMSITTFLTPARIETGTSEYKPTALLFGSPLEVNSCKRGIQVMYTRSSWLMENRLEGETERERVRRDSRHSSGE